MKKARAKGGRLRVSAFAMHSIWVYDGYMVRHLSLRIPEDLLARLHAAAERDHRSVNGEALWLLERGLDRDEKAGE